MRTVRADALEVGDTIEINLSGSKTASLTKVEVNEDGVWTEWNDGLNIELPLDQYFDVLD